MVFYSPVDISRPGFSSKVLFSKIRKCSNERYSHFNYILDFVCLEKKLVVELDGGQHCANKEEDDERSRWLESEGYKVLRFWNREVFLETEAVLKVIGNALTKL